MSISDRTRKLLWARSGNRCAICNSELTVDVGHSDSVLADECHIVGRRAGSARHEPLGDAERDSYDNLILLCKTHHALVDDNPEIFTKDALGTIKANHEKRVRRLLEQEPNSRGWVESIRLDRVQDGTALARVIGGAEGYVHDHPHPQTEEQAAMFADLLQGVQDWCDIWDEIGLSGQVGAARHLDELLTAVRTAGFDLVAGRGQYRLPGDTAVNLDAVAVRIIKSDRGPR